LEKKATRCHNPVAGIFYNKTAPVAKLLVSVDNLKESSSFSIFRTGAVVNALFSALKTFCCFIPQV